MEMRRYRALRDKARKIGHFLRSRFFLEQKEYYSMGELIFRDAESLAGTDGDTVGRSRSPFPSFIMRSLINLCNRDKYSGVATILIDITKEYS